MRKTVCLLIVLTILTCIGAGCTSQQTQKSNQVLEIKVKTLDADEDEFNHDFCFSHRPEEIKETVDNSRIEVAFLGQEYQGQYVSTFKYGGGQSDQYVYRVVGAIPCIDPAYPYIIIDSSDGHPTAIGAFDFAHISIEEDDTFDSVLDKVEETFDAYVDFSVYTFREASDFHGGYTCEWRRQTSQCKMRSSICVQVDAEGNIDGFVRDDICDDVPTDYTIPLQEKELAQLAAQKLQDIYNTKTTNYVAYKEAARVLTRYQNKMALIMSIVVTFNNKSIDGERDDLCELLILLE